MQFLHLGSLASARLNFEGLKWQLSFQRTEKPLSVGLVPPVPPVTLSSSSFRQNIKARKLVFLTLKSRNQNHHFYSYIQKNYI